jgi:hypothetical protein
MHLISQRTLIIMFDSVNEYFAGIRSCAQETTDERLEKEFYIWDNYSIIVHTKNIEMILDRMMQNDHRHEDYIKKSGTVTSDLYPTHYYEFVPDLMAAQIFQRTFWPAPIPFPPNECSQIILNPYLDRKQLKEPYSQVLVWVLEDICAQLQRENVPFYLPNVSDDYVTSPGIMWPSKPLLWYGEKNVFTRWCGEIVDSE